MTVQSSVMMHLLSLIPDVELREKVREQYYQDVEANVNYAQSSYLDLAMRLESAFDEKVTTRFGATNEMISEAVGLVREGGVALRELRSDFRDWIAQIVHISEDVDELRARLNEHDQDIASFRESRDQSIADRAQLKTDLAESKADRATIHTELQSAKNERQEIMRQLADIQDMLRGRPNNDQAKELVALIHQTKDRVDRLEANDE